MTPVLHPPSTSVNLRENFGVNCIKERNCCLETLWPLNLRGTKFSYQMLQWRVSNHQRLTGLFQCPASTKAGDQPLQKSWPGRDKPGKEAGCFLILNKINLGRIFGNWVHWSTLLQLKNLNIPKIAPPHHFIAFPYRFVICIAKWSQPVPICASTAANAPWCTLGAKPRSKPLWIALKQGKNCNPQVYMHADTDSFPMLGFSKGACSYSNKKRQTTCR